MWLRSNGAPWDKRVCYKAALHGHDDVLYWAAAQGAPMRSNLWQALARRGNVAMLDWARGHDVKWDKQAAVEAAAYGKLDALQWIIEAGYPFLVAKVCASLAERGHLRELVRLHDLDPAGARKGHVCEAAHGGQTTVLGVCAVLCHCGHHYGGHVALHFDTLSLPCLAVFSFALLLVLSRSLVLSLSQNALFRR